MTDTMDQHILALNSRGRVYLYDVDLTHIDGPVLHFTSNYEVFKPATVTRLEDTSLATRGRITTSLEGLVEQGDTITVEFYLRDVSGGGERMDYGLIPAADLDNVAQSALARVSADATVADAEGTDTPSGTAHTTHCSIAGEWAYTSARFTVGDPTATLFTMEPASKIAGGLGPAAETRIGAKHVFGLRMWRHVGGLRIPVLLPGDLTAWDVGPNTIATEEANTAEATKVPVHNGNTYTPVPVEADGFEVTGQGRMPTPRIRMSNITGAGSLLMQQYGDIRGATVTRIQMYAENLDNGPNPDPLSTYTPEIYTLDRMTSQNHQLIEFELTSLLDQQGVQLPRRQILRDVCPWHYRVWDGTQFQYAEDDQGCPYTGDVYFDIHGNFTANPAEDVCSHRLTTGCRKRYGTNETLPFGGFPMVGRFRT